MIKKIAAVGSNIKSAALTPAPPCSGTQVVTAASRIKHLGSGRGPGHKQIHTEAQQSQTDSIYSFYIRLGDVVKMYDGVADTSMACAELSVKEILDSLTYE